jgi:Icc-related predicted phosphoesterase
MKVCCISDMHGNLPKIPDCDLLLIAGDIVPVTMHESIDSKAWMNAVLKKWLAELATRMKIIAVAGNHDFIFQERPDWVPEMGWTYLQDSGTEFGGLQIYGSPWQPYFYNWAFNLYEPDLVKKWSLIPTNTDILLLHGPPYGYGDWSIYDHVHTGSPGLLEKIEEIKPKLVVYGHIHSSRGRYSVGDTILINASIVNEKYKPVNEPFVVEL